MTGKIAGIPLVLIVLVVLIVAPLLYGEVLLSHQITDTRNMLIQLNAVKITPLPTQAVTETPTATPTVGVKAFRSVPATTSGQAK